MPKLTLKVHMYEHRKKYVQLHPNYPRCNNTDTLLCNHANDARNHNARIICALTFTNYCAQVQITITSASPLSERDIHSFGIDENRLI